jgi:hypothetical protein
MITVKLLRHLDKIETADRNALSHSIPGYTLSAGEVGELVEILDEGRAFLVAFGEDDAGACKWLGVLYVGEAALQPHVAAAA